MIKELLFKIKNFIYDFQGFVLEILSGEDIFFD